MSSAAAAPAAAAPADASKAPNGKKKKVPNTSKAMLKLIADLRKKPESKARDAMIEKALAEVYSDNRSKLMSPQLALIADARAAGFVDISDKVSEDGAYDDSDDEGFEAENDFEKEMLE